MASALNAVYLALVVLVGIIGTLFVASIRSADVRSRWLELSSVGIVILFLLALGVQFFG
jgi:energy-converting hydrogenase Eha subunit E